MEREKRKSLRKDERAISPVIGVILMVAVTVIMAAIIMSWSAGIKAPETPRQCGVTVSRVDPDTVSITVTSREPVTEPVAYINYTGTANGTVVRNQMVMDYTSENGGNGDTVLVGQANVNVPHDRGEHLIVTCTWTTDNRMDVLYDAVI